ncbi:hypothetical protein AX774_g7252 [Zancudomyces culisetae]|uniref:Uncharacterized protein n=1 Tax=Zancudomyces culisetae TaxID=1213189 RepID=A0A1R1PEE9_ZANCU|nr:hypothetical protein AX774_g7252 [Zancudomyces culisetae]|eukprot:OMH79336.1 hypothetical protein AX774_g7252 [Zancudomyces culisetae]
MQQLSPCIMLHHYHCKLTRLNLISLSILKLCLSLLLLLSADFGLINFNANVCFVTRCSAMHTLLNVPFPNVDLITKSPILCSFFSRKVLPLSTRLSHSPPPFCPPSTLPPCPWP